MIALHSPACESVVICSIGQGGRFDFNSISDISSFSVPLISGHFRYYSLFFIIFALGCSEFKTASPVIRSEMWGKNTDRE